MAGERAKEILKDNKYVEIVDDQYAALEEADALAVITEWNQFRNPDFNRIKKELKAPLIFDGRNLYPPRLMGEMGFAYFSIGRKTVG